MTRPVQVAVVGPADADGELLAAAEEVGRRVAEARARIVCGGLGGVMESVARGAAEAGGDVVGILPTTNPGDANAHVTHPVATGAGQARNVAVVASADVVIAIGGSWGTLSEIAHARRLGRPVVAVLGWEVRGKGSGGVDSVPHAGAAVDAALACARGERNDV